METHQILAMIAGYNPDCALKSTGSEAYRLSIPGLDDVDVPVSWPQHYNRVVQEYGHDEWTGAGHV